MGFFSSDPARDERARDQVERGGTRASSTLQQENKGDASARIEWIRERAVDAGGDRRGEEDRRG